MFLPFHACPSCGRASLREFTHCISCNTMVCGSCGDNEKYGHICGICLEKDTTMKINLVLFDMDGVIVDSMPMLEDLGIQTIIRTYPVSRISAIAMYNATVGCPFHEQLELLFPNNPSNIVACQSYEKSHADMSQHFTLAEGAVDLMNWLYAEHYATGLVTSTTRDIVRIMNQVCDLKFNFLGGYEKNYDKVDQILRAKKCFETSQDNTILFGDSKNDEIFAAKAKVLFHLVTHRTLQHEVKHVLEMYG